MQVDLIDEVTAKQMTPAAIKSDLEKSKTLNEKYRREFAQEGFNSNCSKQLNVFAMEQDLLTFVDPDTSEFGIGGLEVQSRTANFSIKCKGCDEMLPVYKQ